VPIDSPLAIILLGEHQKVSERDALIYWDEDSLLQGAAAVERVLSLMPRWRVLGSLLALLPERFTEASYDLFASNRYRWNERLTECKIPDPQMAERLLGQ
jgi:predicted DCC family thiol-disulfide oxidoreductase YuxK